MFVELWRAATKASFPVENMETTLGLVPSETCRLSAIIEKRPQQLPQGDHNIPSRPWRLASGGSIRRMTGCYTGGYHRGGAAVDERCSGLDGSTAGDKTAGRDVG